MASRIGILVVAFLSYVVVASGFVFQIPGLLGPDKGFLNPPANEQFARDPEQQKVQTGNNSALGGLKKPQPKPVQQPEPNQQPKDRPVQEPGPKPVKQPDNRPFAEPKPNQQPGNRPGQEPGPKQGPGGPVKGLREDFYKQSCPEAENIMNATIHKHFLVDPTYAAGIVRLFFHDCFVTGCDASILLDTTPSHEFVEKKAIENGRFVRGYEVVDDIKLQLEAACPGVVSCADVLAFATRDSLVYTGVPRYPVAAGRRDRRASIVTNVKGNLPVPEFTAEESIELFRRKGLTLEELVVLIGAHSIGSAHCSVVADRFHDEEKLKDIDRGYWLKMQTMTICASNDQDVPFDPSSQHKMDAKFYNELLTKKALIESDQNLVNEPRANGVMKRMAGDQVGWFAKFTNAIRRLGETEVLVGDEGEVRRLCRAVN